MSELNTPHYPFSAIVGHDALKLALTLTAIDPRIGGVLIEGPRGTAKSTIARALADLMPEGRFVTLPLGATEERLVGTLNLEKVLQDRSVDWSPGLLQAADKGVLYVDEVNLLADHLVDLLLDAAASGVNTVERDGISHSHPARFVLIGTMNPDEGELRPQLLDRFGLAVSLTNDIDRQQRIEIVKRRLAFDSDPWELWRHFEKAQTTLIDRCRSGRQCREQIALTEEAHQRVAELCCQANVDGLRADLVMLRAARAHAAWEQRECVRSDDVEAVAELALRHRRKKQPEASSPSHPSQFARLPEAGHRRQQQATGEWGELPPRAVPQGVNRQVDSLLKKKA